MWGRGGGRAVTRPAGCDTHPFANTGGGAEVGWSGGAPSHPKPRPDVHRAALPEHVSPPRSPPRAGPEPAVVRRSARARVVPGAQQGAVPGGQHGAPPVVAVVLPAPRRPLSHGRLGEGARLSERTPCHAGSERQGSAGEGVPSPQWRTDVALDPPRWKDSSPDRPGEAGC